MGTITRNFANFATGGDDKLVNDLSTLALREATQSNRAAVGTNSQYIDVFQDDTGLATETNVDRNASEYMSSVSSSVATADAGGSVTGIQDNNTNQSGASSFGNYGNGNGGQVGTNTADYNVQIIGTSAYLTGDFVLGFSNASITNSDSHSGLWFWRQFSFSMYQSTRSIVALARLCCHFPSATHH